MTIPDAQALLAAKLKVATARMALAPLLYAARLKFAKARREAEEGEA